MIPLNGKYTSADIMIDTVEPECISQIRTFLNHPAFTNPVKIMPDCHTGKGSVIGFTMKLTDKVIPATIGVDIGCGVVATRLGGINSVNRINFNRLDESIRKKVPMGFSINSESKIDMSKDFPWDVVHRNMKKLCYSYSKSIGNIDLPPDNINYEWFLGLCRDIGASPADVEKSIGTLGNGNHFIEISCDSRGWDWLIVHTGSRNFGLRIANHYQKISEYACSKGSDEYASKLIKLKERYSGKELGDKISILRNETPKYAKELSYLSDPSVVSEYLNAMVFAQEFAHVNRNVITDTVINSIPGAYGVETIESVHNYIDTDDLIIRKGAIRAYKNTPVIIPFNMRDGSIIGIGKSNPEWNYSAPHGAGRVMSRSQAKKTLSVEEFTKTMNGIYTTSVSRDTIDESPNAYKDCAVIRDAIEPTVEIVDFIKPVYNLKAGGD